jgi:hypothetical protein
MQHGLDYEAEGLSVYSAVTGHVLYPETIGSVVHPNYNWLSASPDAVCEYLPILVELKCPVASRDIPEEIKPMHVGQLQATMFCTGIHAIHYVRYVRPNLFDPGHIDIREVSFDFHAWWTHYMPLGRAFYDELMGYIASGAKIPIRAKRSKDSKHKEKTAAPPKRVKLIRPQPTACLLVPDPSETSSASCSDRATEPATATLPPTSTSPCASHSSAATP